MTIGKLLKKYRTQQHKTQEKWVGNIISRSYYTRIEKDLHHLSAEDLIKLLHYNNISVINFFSELDESDRQNYNQEQIFNELINNAYYLNSKKELEKVKLDIKKSNITNKDRQIAITEAAIALLDNDLSNLNDHTKQFIKNLLLDLSVLDKKYIKLYRNFMLLYDIDQNIIIARKLINQFKNNKDIEIKKSLLVVIANILFLCIQNNKYNETDFFVKSAEVISTSPEVFFYKNCISLLKNMIAYHYQPQNCFLENCRCIIKIIEINGMPEYSNELAKFFKQNI
ncbi:helix-turn-helix domain-containing protein [Lactobacillus sp. ESL0679]|uniref:helix-turn-helix domain-containing protein n=1 Tax=Lactobacillus sp. ESL0679 TaxID=2983209 RepID=UPI0023FA34A6|nr:Rgg/GadR/MutR family transcriptional regulator [Lactobacillus sp. ESL0679]MDF7683297.1 helix-turn-helix domain-containing protein [Lactobacillus sp. ESL0679]